MCQIIGDYEDKDGSKVHLAISCLMDLANFETVEGHP